MEQEKKKVNFKSIIPIVISIIVTIGGLGTIIVMGIWQSYSNSFLYSKELENFVDMYKLTYNNNLIPKDYFILNNAWFTEKGDALLSLSNNNSPSDTIYTYFVFDSDKQAYDFVALTKGEFTSNNMTISDDYYSERYSAYVKNYIKSNGSSYNLSSTMTGLVESQMKKEIIEGMKETISNRRDEIMKKENELNSITKKHLQDIISLVEKNNE